MNFSKKFIIKLFLFSFLFFVIFYSTSTQSTYAKHIPELFQAIPEVNIKVNKNIFNPNGVWRFRVATKSFKSTGEPIYFKLTNVADPERPSSLAGNFVRKINIALQEKKGSNNWKTVYSKNVDFANKQYKFNKNIKRGATYRFYLSFPKNEKRTYPPVAHYQIKQNAPLLNFHIVDIVPKVDVKNKRLYFVAKEKDRFVNVVGNLTYEFEQPGTNPRYVTYFSNRRDMQIKNFPWPKTSLWRESGHQKKGGTYPELLVTFVGENYNRIRNPKALAKSYFHMQHKHGNLTVKQQVDAAKQTIKVTAKNPMPMETIFLTQYSTDISQKVKPTNAKTKWTFELIEQVDKNTEKRIGKPKTVQTSHKRNIAAATFKKSDYQGHRNVHVKVTIERVDIKNTQRDDFVVVTTGTGKRKIKNIPPKPTSQSTSKTTSQPNPKPTYVYPENNSVNIDKATHQPKRESNQRAQKKSTTTNPKHQDRQKSDPNKQIASKNHDKEKQPNTDEQVTTTAVDDTDSNPKQSNDDAVELNGEDPKQEAINEEKEGDTEEQGAEEDVTTAEEEQVKETIMKQTTTPTPPPPPGGKLPKTANPYAINILIGSIWLLIGLSMMRLRWFLRK